MARMEDIAKRRPADESASKVVSKPGHGFTFQSRKKISPLFSDVPLPIRESTNSERLSEQFVDFTGQMCGRMTVIGQSATVNSKWVCRCPCGNYMLRNSRAIRTNRPIDDDCCDLCQEIKYLRRHDAYLRGAKQVDNPPK